MLFSMMLLGALASIDPLRPAAFALVLSRKRQNGVAFLIGWTAALSLLFAVAFVALGGDASQPPSSTQRTSASVLVLILGIGLLVVAARRWSRRNEMITGHVVPDSLMRRLDDLNLRRSGLLGALIQPRSLTVAAALVCARDRTDAFDLVIGFTVFAAVSTAALIGLLIYDARYPTESRSHLTKIVELIDRRGPRLVTFGSAAAGVYLVVNSLVHLI